ncbi:MAG: SLC13 family permease [Polyangiaceae bacterium]|nr:SLC13 family permease [Polyangiaceae bacterium]
MDLTRAGITLAVLIGVLGLLVFTSLGADAVLLAGLAVVVVTGVVDTRTAISGFSNEGMLTVAALFVVAAGVRQTGAMSRVAGLLLGRSQRTRVALARLLFPVAAMSSLLNNTPIVAALLPAVREWARRHEKPASKLLIPLSYAAILGGTVTVIGTSTNLVVTGLIQKNLASTPGLSPIGVFDISPIGATVAIIGCLVLVAFGPWLLPDRRPGISHTDDPRQYTSEFLVAAKGPLVGATIEEAGLRHLPGAFLAELGRGTAVLPAVEPTTRLEAGDRLVFVGPREAVIDLQRIAGIAPAPNQTFQLDAPTRERSLVEAVVAPGNPLCGRSIREGGFRKQFHAVVIAAARDGHRLGGRIGDIVLEPGDVLLLECATSWVEDQRNRRDFYLVSEVPDSARFRHDRAFISLVILVAMVLAAATELTTMFRASVVAAAALVLTGCLTGTEARRSVELTVLVAIASAFGLGEAIRASGLDRALSESIISLGASSPYSGMVAMYVATALLTELVTNNAAAALMFPFGLSLAEQLGASPMPYCVTVMFAASASFSTPIGYQTNLMVYGPGGYRFTDFLRIGIPMQIAVGFANCLLIPWVFPF